MEDDLGEEDNVGDKEEGTCGGGGVERASDIGMSVGGGKVGQ